MGNSSTTNWWDDFWSADFMPHGHCYMWRTDVLWAHVISDILITISYYSIPVILFFFIRKRRDIPFSAIFVIFGIFIMACGTTHLIDAINVWQSNYQLSAIAKIITAIVSVTAVIMLIPVIPHALALPSLKAAHLKLQKTTDELRRSNEELQQFAYVASHDLQEPLRMISMHLDLIQRNNGREVESKQSEYCRIAIEGAGRMRSLIDALLNYCHIDHADAPVNPVDMNEALADAQQNLAALINANNAIITHETLPNVYMDRAQLTQVLQNLLGNAIRYRREETPRISITAKKTHQNYEIAVQDNGIGIESQYFDKIFVVFQRLNDRSTHEGTGIGLSTVKKIIERHGGRIWVESQPGIGSIFRFTVPADTTAKA